MGLPIDPHVYKSGMRQRMLHEDARTGFVLWRWENFHNGAKRHFEENVEIIWITRLRSRVDLTVKRYVSVGTQLGNLVFGQQKLLSLDLDSYVVERSGQLPFRPVGYLIAGEDPDIQLRRLVTSIQDPPPARPAF